MKTLLLSLFTLFLFTFSANAQNTDLTWSELKQVQKEIRTDLNEKQKDELQKLNDIQKAQLAASLETASGKDRMYELAKGLAGERSELSKLHADERSKLAVLQTEERKAFLQNKSSIKP